MPGSRRTQLLVCLGAAVLALTACGDASLRAGSLTGSTGPSPSPQTSALESTTTGVPTSDSIVDEPEPADSSPTPDTQSPSSTAANGPMEPAASDCPDTERGAVVYRPIQRGMLCENGEIAYVFPVTTGRRVPQPGEFVVSSRNTLVRSTVGGHISTMTNFVAFTEKSPRIAFHTVPKTLGGKWVQPLSSVGTLAKWGASSGCIRVLPEDSKRLWNFLRDGDKVRIID